MYVFVQWTIMRLKQLLPVLLKHVQNVHQEAQLMEKQIGMHVVIITK